MQAPAFAENGGSSMKKTVLITAIVLAGALAASAHAQYSTLTQDGPQPAAAFGTNAKLALAWHWSEKTLRSVGVSKVVKAGKGVFCIKPKVSLNLKGIYPQITTIQDASNTLTPLAQADLNSGLCPDSSYIEVETFQTSGTSAKPSDSVGFFLIVE